MSQLAWLADALRREPDYQARCSAWRCLGEACGPVRLDALGQRLAQDGHQLDHPGLLRVLCWLHNVGLVALIHGAGQQVAAAALRR